LYIISADYESCHYLQESDETRRKRQVEMTIVSHDLETAYHAKLQEQMKLQQMRSRFDAKIAINRREIDELYNAKVPLD
jgi:hypothetical protein